MMRKDFVARLGICPHWAAAFVCVWALTGVAAAQTAGLNNFHATPAFEEVDGAAGPRYVWRNSSIAVTLSGGGTLSLVSQTGRQTRITFPGANSGAASRGELPSGNQAIYYIGAAGARRTTASYLRVRYVNLYPGIDLVFVSAGNQLEYSFEIRPHADPNVIRIAARGSVLNLTPEGVLRVGADSGAIAQMRPVAFQNENGPDRLVECEYLLKNGQEAILRVGAYDSSRPLFIDPVLDFSSYLGGPGFDFISAAATDGQGNLYVTGETSSANLTNPSTSTRSSRDAFVAKLNNIGTQVTVVYLGGSSYDSGRGIALDSSANIYVTGVTSSTDFPVTHGAFSTTAPGAQDAFVAKFNSSLALQYSTYLGGGSADSGLAIAVDSAGDAYVAGQTLSTAFPVSTGAFQKSNSGGISDCFISKLNPSGSALVYSTYLGGSGLDLCAGIALDTAGNAYVAGTTYSANFPVLAPLQASILGTATSFVTKLNASGSALIYSTYLGGSNIDNATAIALDSSGAAYVTGDTASIDFPATSAVYQNQLNGLYNVFISKLSPSGSALVYSTFLGGSSSDAAASIAVDAEGRALVGGYTSSSNFPTSGALQATFQGVFDAFVTVLDPAGASLVFSSFFGGAGDDRGYAIAAAPSNTLYLAGVTSSSNFPVSSAVQAALSVAPDAFALKVAYGTTGVPQAVSVTPSSGSGLSQTFAFQYSDSAGAASFAVVYAWFATSFPTATNSCLLYYSPSTNQINLLNDGGTAYTSAIVGAATTLQNSQCSVNVATSSAAKSGNNLTLSLPITFQPGFAGAKSTYLFASDVSGTSTGWQQLGTWTVQTATVTVTAVSVTPASGSGLSQTFALQYSDTAGASSVQKAYVWFTTTSSGSAANSCQLYYQPSVNQVNLLNDAGTSSTAATPGAATTLQNSQCSINMAATSVTLNGNQLAVNAALTFKSAYAGSKNTYLYVSDVSGVNTGWQPLGTWTIPSGSVTVTAVSVTPSSGSGLSQTFAFQYSDSAGAASFAVVYAWFATSFPTATNSCLLYYSPSTNQINLLNDGGTAYTSAIVGAATTLQNSQCSVNVATSSAAKSGNNLTLSLPITFQPGFAGAKSTYLFASDVSGTSTGWQQLGTWTVQTATVTVTAVSVTPASGSGLSQTFALQYSDTAGASSVQKAYVWFTTTSSGSAANSCQLYYQPSVNQVNLLNDAGTSSTAATPGAATTLQNSQCSINMAATSVTLNGNQLAVNAALTFKSAYAGSKNTYLYVSDVSGVNTGWQPLGTWTIPSGSVTVTAVSVTPSSGSGLSQTFAFQYSDSAGAASFAVVYAWFATSFPTATNSCLLYYSPSTNQINLLNDGGTAYTSAIVGAATTLQNSQCSVNVATSSAAKSGNNLTLSLPITFQPGFAGAKSTYLFASDVSGTSTGWQQLGTWTVQTATVTVTAVSVTPASGSGLSQTFALQYSDSAGAASFAAAYAWFTATFPTATNSCLLYYSPSSNQISLLNDGGTAYTPATVGAATTLQNSQCSVNVGTSSATKNGNVLTLSLPITFQPGFAGVKSTYLFASDASGTNTGWQQLGAWTVP